MDIEQLRAGGVGDITGVDPPAGEIPEDPTIHGSQAHVAKLRPVPAVWNGIEHPVHLACREEWVYSQPGALCQKRLQSSGAQLRAKFGRAPALPANGGTQWSSALALPH